VIFVDSNVIIDLLQRDPRWFEWSRHQFGRAEAPVVNLVVVAECARGFDSLESLLAEFHGLGITVEDLPSAAAFEAGRVFSRSRRTSPERGKILADFLIGAHAAAIGAALLTRDARLYRTYFPHLPLIAPDRNVD
jgi:predicted nucleic acid-binding protein